MGEGSHIYGTKTRATEKGYTAKMKRNIVGVEQKIRQLPDEQAHIFDSKGNLVKVAQGKGNRVDAVGYIPPNSIITHNHPLSLGKTGLASIGNSFSANDMASAIINDAKEIRAVTPRYTFSMKRPKGGWGKVSHAEMLAEMKRIEVRVDNEMRLHAAKMVILGGDFRTNNERYSATYWHKVNKELAKRFGWDYTKTKG